MMSFSSSGVTTMKMMRSTSTTSTSGVTLMSEFGRPSLIAYFRFLWRWYFAPRLIYFSSTPSFTDLALASCASLSTRRTSPKVSD